MNDTAAIILAAGKGTRMGSAPINKVCFDCAGVPVIRRIVENFRAGGVRRFVVVIGHRAESVMRALDGVPGVLYAYQGEQHGTGHAAMCGLTLLESIGFSGPVIISVGDRLVGSPVVRGLLARAGHSLAVWGAEPVAQNPTGGRIVEVGGRPRGVVEFFDAALMSVLALPEEERGAKLRALGMGERKASLVLEFARKHPDEPTERYGLSADDIIGSRYANCSLYCFDFAAALRVLRGLKGDNVQGELYITDALEVFADEQAVELYPVENADEMLTYSTRPELRAIAHKFLRRASEMEKVEKRGEGIYDGSHGEHGESVCSSRSPRLNGSDDVHREHGEHGDAADSSVHPSAVNLLAAFRRQYGDRPCIIASAPGRVNLMGRHIEHRGGSTNMMATRQRMTFVVAPREDDTVRIANLDPAFPSAEFKISDYIQFSDVHGEHGEHVESLCSSRSTWKKGADGVSHGEHGEHVESLCSSRSPRLKGSVGNVHVERVDHEESLSSSRSPRLKESIIPFSTQDWLDFLDSSAIRADLDATRGHWVNYVKAAVLRFQAATDMPLCGMDILATGDIPVAAGLSSSSAIVVATAEAIVALNELNLSTREFVDLCGEGEWYVGSRGGAGDHAAMKCSKAGSITHLKFKPFEIGESVPFPASCAIVVINSGEQAKKAEGARETFNARILDYETALAEVKRHYPDWPLTYFRDLAFLPDADRAKAIGCLTGTVKGVAMFGINECRRSEDCLELLKKGDFAALGAMMKESHDGDRLGKGEYECSTVRIDALCDRLNAMPGVYGSQLVGAGLGGSVIALVEKTVAEKVLNDLRSAGYDACVSQPCEGSKVKF